MLGGDLVVCANHQSALNHVFQLTHIAGPGIGQQKRLRLRGNGVGVAIGGRARQQLGCQRQYVARALCQRGHAQFERADAKVQIFTKLAPANGVAQILVGGGNHPHVEVSHPLTAQAYQHALLQHAQQLGLQVNWHLGNFIQKQRAALGLFKQALVFFHGAGEGAFLMAKQHVFNHLLGHGGAVQSHKRPACAV